MFTMLRGSLFAICCSLTAVWATRSEVSGRAIGHSESLQPRFFGDLGAQRTKLKYGPFKVPASSVDMGMKSFGLNGIALPCSDCYVTNWVAGLEYPDGTSANADTNMWLHHVVLAAINTTDAVCPGNQHAVGRTFASGNERTVVDLTKNGSATLSPSPPPPNSWRVTTRKGHIRWEFTSTQSPCGMRPSS